MTELSFTARRVLFIALLFVLGVLAAAAPALLGEPAGEHPALRGIAALLIAFPAGLFLAARWGIRGPLPAKEHGLELVTLVAASTIPLLPALFAGVSTTEVVALTALAQTTIGWKTPVAAAPLALLLLVATYVVARLKGSVKESRFVGRGLVAVAGVACLVLVLASTARLLLIPALFAVELLVKAVLLMVLGALGVAAFLPGKTGGRDFDPRTLALAISLAGVGLCSAYGTYRYLRPAVSDIERILVTHGDDQGTTFAAALEYRPDIYGLFSLQYASATPRLDLVRPLGSSIDYLIEKVTPTIIGTARLEPRLDFERTWSELRRPPVAESFVEVWIRLGSWPWIDLRPGLSIREPVYDWAVSPSGSFAVASTYVRSPDAWPGRRQMEIDEGIYAVDIWRRGEQAQRLIDNLPLPPRILELSERSVRLLVNGQSYSRGQLRRAASAPVPRREGGRSWEQARADGFALATSYVPAPSIFGGTTCDLSTVRCEPWQVWGEIPPRIVKPGRRTLVGGSGAWSLIDSHTLATVFALPRCSTCSGDSDFAYLLRDGGVVRLSLLGRMPNWESRLSAYDAEGQETAVTSLGNFRQTRFAGELDDGTVAILWRVPYAYGSLTNPVFGWTLDSWNLTTGERHRLADDIATFPSSQNDGSMIFLDRRGRLVVPAVDGVRALGQLGYPLPLN